jgi:hypothetical protein
MTWDQITPASMQGYPRIPKGIRVGRANSNGKARLSIRVSCTTMKGLRWQKNDRVAIYLGRDAHRGSVMMQLQTSNDVETKRGKSWAIGQVSETAAGHVVMTVPDNILEAVVPEAIMKTNSASYEVAEPKIEKDMLIWEIPSTF